MLGQCKGGATERHGKNPNAVFTMFKTRTSGKRSFPSHGGTAVIADFDYYLSVR